jgi:hypothetical protein
MSDEMHVLASIRREVHRQGMIRSVHAAERREVTRDEHPRHS